MKSIFKQSLEIFEIDEFSKRKRDYKSLYVYAFFNKKNGKFYIGSSSNLKNRFKHYYRAATNTLEFHSKSLRNAVDEYSKDDFLFLILEKVESLDKLLSREQFYLDKYKPFGERGYNTNLKAHSSINSSRLPNVREANSIRQAGEKSNQAKLKKEDIIDIFNEFAWNSKSRKELAKKYGVSSHQITIILRRRCWCHVEIDEKTLRKVEETFIPKMSEDQAFSIGIKLKRGESPKKISQEFKTSVTNIHNINTGRSFPNVKAKLNPKEKFIYDFKVKNRKDEGLWLAIEEELAVNSNRKIVAEKLGVSPNLVSKVKKLLKIQRPPSLMSSEVAANIANLLNEGLSTKEIMKICGVSSTTVNKINKGEIYPEEKARLSPSSSYINPPKNLMSLSRKKDLVKMIKLGEKTETIRNVLGFSRTFINKWQRMFRHKHSQAQNS
jgi:group I intron endonuclease